MDLPQEEDKKALRMHGLSFAATAGLHIDHDINWEGNHA
jgi:hypothetical protein